MFQPTSALGDANAYRAIFFEETQDHLALVEAILLRLQPDQPYLDDLNAIFRAVHSIKGSAANVSALGLSQAAAVLETQARAGTLSDSEPCLAELSRELERFFDTLDEALESLKC